MIAQFFSDLGPWTWLIIGLLLLVGEAVVPGVFLMWFGLAGLVVGLATLLQLGDTSWWSWQVQLVAFGLLSLVFILVGNRVFPSGTEEDEASKMNDPLSRHIGSSAVLIEPIESGSGRVKLGDTTWRVAGPELEEGVKVTVTGVENGILQVEKA